MVAFGHLGVRCRIRHRRCDPRCGAQKATRLYPRWISTLAFTYNLTPVECTTFHTWERVKARRKSLPKRDRAAFDALHSAIVRLMEHHAGGRRGSDMALVRELHEARRVAII